MNAFKDEVILSSRIVVWNFREKRPKRTKKASESFLALA